MIRAHKLRLFRPTAVATILATRFVRPFLIGPIPLKRFAGIRQHSGLGHGSGSNSITMEDGDTTQQPQLPHDGIRSQKKALRSRIRKAIKERITPEERATQSQMVWNRLYALPLYQSARSVGLFLSMPAGEIDTDPALAHAVANGKDVYVPEVGANFELCDMELRKVILDEAASNCSGATTLFHKSWPRNKWGIPEPPPDMPAVPAEPGDIDLLVVPGLAFDRNGNRLGQGKGYYDRFIARMAKEHKLPLVAVCLAPQFVTDTDIPVAEYDRRMDILLTPSETIVISTDT